MTGGVRGAAWSINLDQTLGRCQLGDFFICVAVSCAPSEDDKEDEEEEDGESEDCKGSGTDCEGSKANDCKGLLAEVLEGLLSMN